MFVGLRLVKKLVEEGHEVTTLNRGTREQPYEVTQLHADRKRPSDVTEALRGLEFDAAFDISAYRPAETGTVIDALEGKVDRLVHCSTGAVYGSKGPMPKTEESPLDRTAKRRTYAGAKVRCENLLFAAHEETGFPAVIIRPSYVYGPHNYIYREAYLFDRLEAGRPVLIPEGVARVQLGHVDDLAAAFLEAATRKGVEGEAFNVTGQEAVTFRQLAETAGEAAGIGPSSITIKESKGLASHFPFGNFTFLCDVSKAREALGLRPRSLRIGMEDTYAWYETARPFGPPDFSEDDRLLARGPQPSKG